VHFIDTIVKIMTVDIFGDLKIFYAYNLHREKVKKRG